MRIEQSIPVLHVASSKAAEAFYCGQLGFAVTFAYRPDSTRADPCYLGLVRDGAALHVSSFAGDGRPGSVVVLVVDDVDALYAELSARTVTFELTPTDQTWGNREMYVNDPDGNGLRFTQHLAP